VQQHENRLWTPPTSNAENVMLNINEFVMLPSRGGDSSDKKSCHFYPRYKLNRKLRAHKQSYGCDSEEKSTVFREGL
jgi:hypothetical protein